jgi:hypothetical protein
MHASNTRTSNLIIVESAASNFVDRHAHFWKGLGTRQRNGDYTELNYAKH